MELRTGRFNLKELKAEVEKDRFSQEKIKEITDIAERLKKNPDDIEFVRKGIPIDPKDISIKDGERAAIRLVTTPRLDRDGEILIPDGAVLDDFRQSPSVLFGHDYKSLPVGKDLWIKKTKNGILAKTVFDTHAFAEDVYNSVKGGFLNSNSVGFIPLDVINSENDKKQFKEWQKILKDEYGVDEDESARAKNIYTKWLMLEHSDVPVASNAHSLNIAVSKGELPITTDKFKKELEIEIVDSKESDTQVIEIIEKDEPIEIIEKPETTENYHHIPVNPGCEITATITISAKQGIKATYCGKVKKIHTYLFDKNKWSMEEAKRWVEEHKDFTELVFDTEFYLGEPGKEGSQQLIDAEDIYETFFAEDSEEEEEKYITTVKQDEEAEKFTCECIECGHKIETEEHCKDVECPKCGGEMRRAERPGPGRNLEADDIKEILIQAIAEVKEGRVLSAKTRTLINNTITDMKQAIKALEELLEATEPPPKEDTEKGVEIIEPEEMFDKRAELVDIIKEDKPTVDKVNNVVELLLGHPKMGDMIKEAVSLAFDKLRGKIR